MTDQKTMTSGFISAACPLAFLAPRDQPPGMARVASQAPLESSKCPCRDALRREALPSPWEPSFRCGLRGSCSPHKPFPYPPAHRRYPRSTLFAVFFFLAQTALNPVYLPVTLTADDSPEKIVALVVRATPGLDAVLVQFIRVRKTQDVAVRIRRPTAHAIGTVLGRFA
jgi:hypothetical protein